MSVSGESSTSLGSALNSCPISSATPGVSSVISMAAIIGGLNKFVQDKVESLGSRTYFLTRFPFGTDPFHIPERIRIRKYFEYNYADFIRSAAPDVEIVTTVGTRGFIFGDTNLITSGDRSVEKLILRGAEPDYTTAIPLFNVGSGRFIRSSVTPAAAGRNR